jgi:hypothetical protein
VASRSARPVSRKRRGQPRTARRLTSASRRRPPGGRA